MNVRGGEADSSVRTSQREHGGNLLVYGTVFLVLGMIFSGAIFLLRSLEKEKTRLWEETPAVVTDMKRSMFHSKRLWTSVSYQYQGADYEDIHLNYTSTSLNPGMEVTILVNPQDPEDIYINGETSGKIELPLFLAGTVLLAAGVIMCFRGILFCYGFLTVKELSPDVRERRGRIYGKIFCVCVVLFLAGIAIIFFWPVGPIMYGIVGLAILFEKIKGRK